jgi:hypothetical protein
LGIKIFFLCLDRLLIGRRKYFDPLTIVIGFVLTSALGVTSIFRVGDSYITARLVIKVNRFLITGTRGYLVSVSLDIVS